MPFFAVFAGVAINAELPNSVEPGASRPLRLDQVYRPK
jgi:hypothetical protein